MAGGKMTHVAFDPGPFRRAEPVMTRAIQTKRDILPLESGAHLSAQEFMERYEASEPELKAELIDGVVYVASPLSIEHGDPHAALATWLGTYMAAHAGVRLSDNATIRLGPKDIPQPDLHLRYLESRQNKLRGKYLEGPPELAAEVAVSSTSIDLHEKLDAYRRHGVQEYIVWRVFDRAIDWFALDAGEYRRLEPDEHGIVRSRVFPGLCLDVDAMLRSDLAGVLARQREEGSR
jgi:Uma2 family endonuclease